MNNSESNLYKYSFKEQCRYNDCTVFLTLNNAYIYIMEKKDNAPLKISSISELHDILQVPKPLHPLISLVDNTTMSVNKEILNRNFVLNFYKISYKFSENGKMGYGQGYYDFNEGGMMFTAPNQILSTDEEAEYHGYTLFIHPDFIRNYPLAKNIKKYGFFSCEGRNNHNHFLLSFTGNHATLFN